MKRALIEQLQSFLSAFKPLSLKHVDAKFVAGLFDLLSTWLRADDNVSKDAVCYCLIHLSCATGCPIMLVSAARHISMAKMSSNIKNLLNSFISLAGRYYFVHV